jgi:hypothetical protein
MCQTKGWVTKWNDGELVTKSLEQDIKHIIKGEKKKGIPVLVHLQGKIVGQAGN